MVAGIRGSATAEEIAGHPRVARRFREIDAKLDDRNRSLRVLRRDSTRPPEVRRRQAAELEAEIADPKTARRGWEDEARTTCQPRCNTRRGAPHCCRT